MSAHVSRGTAIFRAWDRTKGLDETYQTLHSMDELFQLCLTVHETHGIDRIILHGQDDRGVSRTVTFTFQSLTVASD